MENLPNQNPSHNENNQEPKITKEQVDKLFEQNPAEIYKALGLQDGTIDPSEAGGDKLAVTSVVEEKRDIGYLWEESEPILARLQYHGLHLLDAGVDQEGYQKYVFYKKNKEDAEKLAEISKRHGGYLSSKAPVEDQIEISNLLNYKMASTIAFLKKNNRENEVKELYLKKVNSSS